MVTRTVATYSSSLTLASSTVSVSSAVSTAEAPAISVCDDLTLLLTAQNAASIPPSTIARAIVRITGIDSAFLTFGNNFLPSLFFFITSYLSLLLPISPNDTGPLIYIFYSRENRMKKSNS